MTYLTTAKRIDLGPVLESGSAREMALYLVSRLIDERDENRAADHWHPELAAPFDEMAEAWIGALKQAGVKFEYRGRYSKNSDGP